MKNLLLVTSGAACFALGIFSAVRPAHAVGLYASYTDGRATQVGTINASNPLNVTFSPLSAATIPAYLTDIAVDSGNNLYGIDLNTRTGSQTLDQINSTGQVVNSHSISGNIATIDRL